MSVTIDQLKKSKGTTYYILLNGGFRSYKTISYNNKTKKFNILNHIDETHQLLTEKELYSKSNIGEAIDKKAFYEKTNE